MHDWSTENIPLFVWPNIVIYPIKKCLFDNTVTYPIKQLFLSAPCHTHKAQMSRCGTVVAELALILFFLDLGQWAHGQLQYTIHTCDLDLSQRSHNQLQSNHIHMYMHYTGTNKLRSNVCIFNIYKNFVYKQDSSNVSEL
jgi:hypothetical protein